MILFLTTSGFLNNNFNKPLVIISKQESALNLNLSLLQIFSLGQSRLISSLLWVTTLLESDMDHYKGNDLNSWIYLRFKSIITLEPNFLKAYQYGGQYLCIVKDDLIGADDIYNIGLSIYPNDYKLLFDSGFLYAFELRNTEKALNSYSKILHHKEAPPYLKTIYAKLKFQQTNDLNQSYQLLLEMYKNEPDNTILKNKLEKDLYSIKAELDLKCLNSTDNTKCDHLDFYGQKYILKNSKFSTLNEFVPYQIYFKN